MPTSIRLIVIVGLALAVSTSSALAGGGSGGGKGKPDKVPPTIAITNYGSAATVAGLVSLAGTSSDNIKVAKVEVKVDGGAYRLAQGTSSWTYPLDTTALANGSHTVTARATDASGNTAAVSIGVNVANLVADTTPPTAAIAVPSPGTTVEGVVTVAGSASDNVQVAKVEVSVDGGAYQPAQGTTGWTDALNTTALANGPHTITARATDTAGNASTASESVNVSNPTPDTTPPTIAVSSPTGGATVKGTVTFAGNAADDVQVAYVEVAVDSGPYQPAQGTTSWSSSLDTTALADGSHTLRARATDNSGNTATASVTVNVSNALPAGVKEQLVTPEGATIQIYSDVSNWTAQQLYDILKPNAYELALIGPHLTIEVQTTYSSSTTTGVSGNPTNGYYNFHATIYLDARPDRVFSSRPDTVVAHEYGHAWTMYHLYMTQRGNWSPYLTERGIATDPRLDSTYNWSKNEMIADDYRLLFGTQKAQDEAAYINPDVADPRTVPGLKSWFATVWSGA